MNVPPDDFPASPPPRGGTSTPFPWAGNLADETPQSLGAGEEGYEEEDEEGDAADWKDALRHDFEAFLAETDELPDDLETAQDDPDDAPDLYSFYEQFAAAGAEARKANRRTAEAISQWGETLARFENGLQPLRESVAQLAAAQPKAARMSRAHCLVLIELLDRLHRIARAFESPPALPPPAKRSWFGPSASPGNDDAWRQLWTSQHQALNILKSHLDGMLEKEGVVRRPSLGQPFDPSTMMAVAAEADSSRPPQTVLEEITSGYVRDGEPLRVAQVKVSR